MALGYTKRLYVLAFDHRGSFEKNLLGVSGAPSEEQKGRVREAKGLIYDGFKMALGDVPKDAAGVLTDEEYGAEVARRARADGVTLAMPAEKSGQDEFELEYGAQFGEHIERFDPTFTKVLVRYNPEADAEMNKRQTGRLRDLATWLHDHDRKFMFELLVPATKDQLAKVGGDQGRYDRELRAELMLRVLAELQDAGVEADVWKIEGLDKREDCERIARQARSGGRDEVGCVVLGRGADSAQVDRWLQAGAGVPGYIGFAIGRSIWFDACKDWLEGKADRQRAARQIADNYSRFVEVYAKAG